MTGYLRSSYFPDTCTCNLKEIILYLYIHHILLSSNYVAFIYYSHPVSNHVAFKKDFNEKFYAELIIL